MRIHPASALFASLVLAPSVVLCAEGPATTAVAQPPPAVVAKWQKASLDELVQGVNTLAGETVQRSQAFEEKNRRVAAAAQNPTETSPEVERLRAKLHTLENEVLALREELRGECEKLPEIKALREDLERDAAALAAVKAERALVQQLLQSKLTPPLPQ